MTSHAAVVARGMGKPCVAGAGDVRIDGKAGTLTVRGTVVKAGDFITLDGATGEVMLGVVPTVAARAVAATSPTLMGWADEVRTLRVRTNADTPLDAAHGAQVRRRGHRPLPHRAHVLRRRPHRRRARDDPGRRRDGPARGAGQAPADAARRTSSSCSAIMAGLPVTIRLLDPPLHEFLPKTDDDMEVVAKALGVAVAEIAARAHKLHEFNPMLGHRGCRLGITYPGDLRDAGPRHLRGARPMVQKKAGKTGDPGDHDPAGRARAKELDAHEGAGRPGRRRGDASATGAEARLPGRHHDRAAARRAARRRDRRDRRVLQLRHQRPDADDLRPVAATTPARSCATYAAAGHPRARSVRHRSTSRASAS